MKKYLKYAFVFGIIKKAVILVFLFLTSSCSKSEDTSVEVENDVNSFTFPMKEGGYFDNLDGRGFEFEENRGNNFESPYFSEGDYVYILNQENFLLIVTTNRSGERECIYFKQGSYSFRTPQGKFLNDDITVSLNWAFSGGVVVTFERKSWPTVTWEISEAKYNGGNILIKSQEISQAIWTDFNRTSKPHSDFCN